MSAPSWRLLRDSATDGAANMARDEALLASAARGATPTLRLYAWIRPTLSLGAHQPGADADLHACRRRGVDLVRRPTGGGAVIHDAEVTYAVAGRLGQSPFPYSVVGVYEGIAAALVAALARMNVPAVAGCSATRERPPADCFARPAHREILVGGRKLIGSAQLRRRGAFLQHGSILLDFDPARLREVLQAAARETPGTTPPTSQSLQGAQGPLASAENGVGPRAPMTLREWTGRAVSPTEVEDALIRGFASAFGSGFEPGALDARESEESATLRASKYLDALWTLEGRIRLRDMSSS